MNLFSKCNFMFYMDEVIFIILYNLSNMKLYEIRKIKIK